MSQRDVLALALALIPLFYGAAKGHPLRGLAWALASFCVPAFLVFIGKSSGFSVLAVAAASMFLVPAWGVFSIGRVAKKAEAPKKKRRKKIKAPGDQDDADRVECPACAELIKAKAKVCRFCGEVFGPSGE